MKTKLALSLLVAALLPACATTKTANTNSDAKSPHYAESAIEAAPPAEGPQDANANPAYMPTPLLRQTAMSGL